jgi:hypothetical protein
VQAHDERNRQTGRTDDINWLLRELGVDEIIFDPPPWRPPPPDRMKEDELPDEEDFAGEPEPNPNLPPAPPLPAVPLSMEEAAKRMGAAVNAFATAADAEAALFESGATLINDVDELTVDMLSDAEFSFCLVFLLQAWFVLVPPGHRPPKISFPDLAAAFDRSRHDLDKAVRSASADGLVNYAKTGCQPELLLLLTSEILKSGKTAPKKIRPSAESLGTMLALVKAVVEELDAALRRRVIHRL